MKCIAVKKAGDHIISQNITKTRAWFIFAITAPSSLNIEISDIDEISHRTRSGQQLWIDHRAPRNRETSRWVIWSYLGIYIHSTHSCMRTKTMQQNTKGDRFCFAGYWYPLHIEAHKGLNRSPHCTWVFFRGLEYTWWNTTFKLA